MVYFADAFPDLFIVERTHFSFRWMLNLVPDCLDLVVEGVNLLIDKGGVEDVEIDVECLHLVNELLLLGSTFVEVALDPLQLRVVLQGLVLYLHVLNVRFQLLLLPPQLLKSILT